MYTPACSHSLPACAHQHVVIASQPVHTGPQSYPPNLCTHYHCLEILCSQAGFSLKDLCDLMRARTHTRSHLCSSCSPLGSSFMLLVVISQGPEPLIFRKLAAGFAWSTSSLQNSVDNTAFMKPPLTELNLCPLTALPFLLQWPHTRPH